MALHRQEGTEPIELCLAAPTLRDKSPTAAAPAPDGRAGRKTRAATSPQCGFLDFLNEAVGPLLLLETLRHRQRVTPPLQVRGGPTSSREAGRVIHVALPGRGGPKPSP